MEHTFSNGFSWWLQVFVIVGTLNLNLDIQQWTWQIIMEKVLSMMPFLHVFGLLWASSCGPRCFAKVACGFGSVLTKPQEIIAHMMQFATIRLASYNMELVIGMLSFEFKMLYMLQGSDMNLKVFTKNWKIYSPFLEYFCTILLHKRSVEKLHQLWAVFCGGWMVKITTHRRDMLSMSTSVWVTQAHCTWGKSISNIKLLVHCKHLCTIDYMYSTCMNATNIKCIMVLCRLRTLFVRIHFNASIGLWIFLNLFLWPYMVLYRTS